MDLIALKNKLDKFHTEFILKLNKIISKYFYLPNFLNN